MQADDLRLEELVQFSEGLVSLHGRRLVIQDLYAFAQFRRDLTEQVGRENARRMLTRFGYFRGQADAAAMKRIFTWNSLEEWLRAGPRMHSIQGVARNVVRELRVDPAAGTFHMEIVWHRSGEAEEHLATFGRSDDCVCWMLVGYASGYASFCMNKEVFFIETECMARGDNVCIAIGKDRASWGGELRPHLHEFEAADVQHKIQALSEKLRRKQRELAEERRKADPLGPMRTPAMIEVRSESFRRVLDLANRVAPFDSSVLVCGETGVGKEVLARHIHAESRRAHGPFVAVNCAALPETLLESELFGHKAGAFTGATRDRLGLFEQGRRGTLFLDEIGDITAAMQLKLLRVVQEREVMRVGESVTRPVDVRVIAATHRDLDELIAEGKFREDLGYRLRVIEIHIPPLRDRREDILPLARHLVLRVGARLKIENLRLDASCLNYLEDYDWPGNVRELENVLERAAVLSQGGLIVPECFPPRVLERTAAAPRLTDRTLAEVELDHIRAVLAAAGGNQSRAARTLGISPSTLWRKLRREPAGG